MTSNKATVLKYMEGFNETDHEKILECLTDDVTWELPGQFNIRGKEAFDKEIENENFTGSPSIKILRLIEENNIVIAEGSVEAKMKNGDLLNIVFCDVFHMLNGKIQHLTSYLMNK